MKKNLHEIFEEFDVAKGERAKRQILVDNATPDLIGFLQGTFDPRVKFIYNKDNLPKFKDLITPIGMGYTNMGNAVKKSYMFIEDHPKRAPTLSKEKMDEVLIQLLESLEPKEARLYIDKL
jgi:hypothetical protein